MIALGGSQRREQHGPTRTQSAQTCSTSAYNATVGKRRHWPSLTHAWQVAPSAFALAFLWSNIGVMAGALLLGPLAGTRFFTWMGIGRVCRDDGADRLFSY